MSRTTYTALAGLLLVAGLSAAGPVDTIDARLEAGRKIYLDGILPSGHTISAQIQGDIALSGKQVICGTCHRRSGLGSSEGDQVIPALAADILFEPLRTPTAHDPLAPQQRPAYSRATLKQAIRAGIDANGELLDPLMPRYPLSDEELDLVIDYIRTLSREHSPGVDQLEIHFATIVAGPVGADKRQALLEVFRVFLEQKNAETRHESFRKENAPWHKKWIFEPYRKWALHLWELDGPAETWRGQLEALYSEQPVFAVLSGVGQLSWAPVHSFCQATQLPCLFPTTDLPVVAEQDFYSLYLSKGIALEAQLLARFQHDQGVDDRPVVQVYRLSDERAKTAAATLEGMHSEHAVRTIAWARDEAPTREYWQRLLGESNGQSLVLWMDSTDLAEIWSVLVPLAGPERIFLSTTLYGTDSASVPVAERGRVFLVHTKELPSQTEKLLRRSTSWLKSKRADVPSARDVQANAYFALKVAGDVLKRMRGYFFRDYMIERIEHMVDNAPYTSVYPRLSLAPGQRFAAKGGYITRISGGANPQLVAVGDWLVP